MMKLETKAWVQFSVYNYSEISGKKSGSISKKLESTYSKLPWISAISWKLLNKHAEDLIAHRILHTTVAIFCTCG